MNTDVRFKLNGVEVGIDKTAKNKDGLRSRTEQPQPGQSEFDAIAIRHLFRSPKVVKTLNPGSEMT